MADVSTTPGRNTPSAGKKREVAVPEQTQVNTGP